MMLKFISFLQRLLGWLLASQNDSEHLQRKASVRGLFHQTLPNLDEEWEGRAIIEGGKFNYFTLPSGDIPFYDFVVPEIPLYVCIPGVVSASWSEARDRGISRDLWEIAQTDLAAIQKGTSDLSTLGMAAEPKFLLIKWDDPINHLTLLDRLKELGI